MKQKLIATFVLVLAIIAGSFNFQPAIAASPRVPVAGYISIEIEPAPISMLAGQHVIVNAHFTDGHSNEIPVSNVSWGGSDDLNLRVTQSNTVQTAADVLSLGKAGTYGVHATSGAVTLNETVIVNPGQLSGGYLQFGTPSEP